MEAKGVHSILADDAARRERLSTLDRHLRRRESAQADGVGGTRKIIPGGTEGRGKKAPKERGQRSGRRALESWRLGPVARRRRDRVRG